MFTRVLPGPVLLCLLANAILVRGSPQIKLGDRQSRGQRHASCPSCSRDCPAALANPWYMQPPRREYGGFETETSGWSSSQPVQAIPPPSYGPYNRAPGGRGAQAIDRPGGTCKRENPFAIHRDFDPNLAPPSSPSIHGLRNPYQSRPQASRTTDRPQYQRGSFQDIVQRPSNPPIGHGYSDYEGEPSFRAPSTVYEDNKKKVHVVYRADRYGQESNEEEQFQTRSDGYASRVFDDREALGQQIVEADRFYQAGRDHPRDLPRVHVPEVRYSPYQSPDLGNARLAQKVGRGGGEVFNDSLWREQFGGPRVREPGKNEHRQQFRSVTEVDDDGPARGGANFEAVEEVKGKRGAMDNVEAEKLEDDHSSVPSVSSTGTVKAETTTESNLMRIPGKKREPQPVEAFTQPSIMS